MILSKANQKWWSLADKRRNKLIDKRYVDENVDLTPEETVELAMLQRVAVAVSDYSDVVLCKKCGGKLELRDTGFFPTHVCAKKKVKAKKK